MVQVDLPAAVAVGQIFGFLSRDYLRKEPHLILGRLLGPFNIYLACGFVPGGMYLLIGWPAWEVMYRTAWFENPFNRWLTAAAYVLFGIVMMALANAGFLLAHHWYRSGNDRRVTWGAAGFTALALLPFAIRWGVWWKIGTYSELKAGDGYSFFQPPFFYGWLMIMSYLFAAVILAGWWFVKTSRRLARSMDATPERVQATAWNASHAAT